MVHFDIIIKAWNKICSDSVMFELAIQNMLIEILKVSILLNIRSHLQYLILKHDEAKINFDMRN